jgi:hypothetical protein
MALLSSAWKKLHGASGWYPPMTHRERAAGQEKNAGNCIFYVSDT